MAIKMKLRAQERSSYIVEVNFYVVGFDRREWTITPNDGLSWSLYDQDGNIINQREDVPIVPNSTIYILLFGEDLALENHYPERRFITIQGTYDNAYETRLPILEEISFIIENLVEKEPG